MGNNSHSDFHGLRTSQPAISKWFANIHSFIRHAHRPRPGLHGALPRVAELTPGHSKGGSPSMAPVACPGGRGSEEEELPA